jgi:hypothetical protein
VGGYKKWNTNDVLTSSNLNEYVGSQVVTVFATTAARDAAITGANLIDGMVCYIASGDSSEGLYAYNGTNWRKGPGWNAPWGVISQKTDSTDRTITTTMAEVASGLRSTATIIGNRYLRFTVEASLAENINNTGFVAQIYDNNAAAVVRRVAQYNTDLGTGWQVANSFVVPSTAGAVYTLRMQAVSHSFNLYGSTVQSTRVTIEDVGPSGNPL